MTTPDQPAWIGIDVGGTNIKSCVLTEGDTIVPGPQVPTPRQLPALIQAVAELAGSLTTSTGGTATGVGVAVPGIVDEDQGMAIRSVNLGWHELALAATLAEAMPGFDPAAVVLGHDVRCGALAEYTIGAGVGSESVLFTAIGTGIAGAFVLAGHTITGHGYAGEIGHIIVDPAGPACPCGSRGCLESIASASAIARRYTELSGVPVPGSREVFIAAGQGDEAATEVIRTAIEVLAVVLHDAVCMLAPDRIVIGGGLSKAGENLLGPLGSMLESMWSFHRAPTLEIAMLGEQAGAIGAALRVRNVVTRTQERLHAE